MMKKPWFSDKTIHTLLKVNGAVFLSAVVVNWFFSWLLLFSLLFWIFTLVCLIQRDLACQSFSFATVVYILLVLSIAALSVYAVIYNITH